MKQENAKIVVETLINLMTIGGNSKFKIMPMTGNRIRIILEANTYLKEAILNPEETMAFLADQRVICIDVNEYIIAGKGPEDNKKETDK
jgi:hypothetical protein